MYRTPPPRPPSFMESLISSLPPSLQGLFRNTSVEILIAVGIGIVACVSLGCICAVLSILLLQSPPAPPTPEPPTLAPQTPIPLATPIPTLNTANIGQFINPFDSAKLDGMTVLQIDVRDATTGSYVRAAQLTGADLNPFITALNVSIQMTAPAPDCIDHVRLTITRADTSIVTFGVCLKGVVILRGIPDFGGADAPMYAGFSDALAPYLPDDYKKLLGL